MKLTYIFGIYREIMESNRLFIIKDIESLRKLQYQTLVMITQQMYYAKLMN